MVRNTASQVLYSMISWLVIFLLHTFNSLFLSVACLSFRRIWKKIQLRTWTKNADVSFAKVTNGDTLKRWSTVSVVGTNGLISSYSLHASLLKQKGSLIVFSCFVSYEGYHKEGNLDFEQRMVKELLELLQRKYHSFSTLMQTWYDQVHLELKFLKWKYEKDVSRFQLGLSLYLNIASFYLWAYSEEREKHRAPWTQRLGFLQNSIIIILGYLFLDCF